MLLHRPKQFRRFTRAIEFGNSIGDVIEYETRGGRIRRAIVKLDGGCVEKNWNLHSYERIDDRGFAPRWWGAHILVANVRDGNFRWLKIYRSGELRFRIAGDNFTN